MHNVCSILNSYLDASNSPKKTNTTLEMSCVPLLVSHPLQEHDPNMQIMWFVFYVTVPVQITGKARKEASKDEDESKQIVDKTGVFCLQFHN